MGGLNHILISAGQNINVVSQDFFFSKDPTNERASCPGKTKEQEKGPSDIFFF